MLSDSGLIIKPLSKLKGSPAPPRTRKLTQSIVFFIVLCGDFESCVSVVVWHFPRERENISWDRAPGLVWSTLNTDTRKPPLEHEQSEFLFFTSGRRPLFVCWLCWAAGPPASTRYLPFTLFSLKIRPGVSCPFDEFCFPWMRRFLCGRLFWKTSTECCWCFIHELDRSDLSSSLTRPLCLCVLCFCSEPRVAVTLCGSASFIIISSAINQWIIQDSAKMQVNTETCRSALKTSLNMFELVHEQTTGTDKRLSVVFCLSTVVLSLSVVLNVCCCWSERDVKLRH